MSITTLVRDNTTDRRLTRVNGMEVVSHYGDVDAETRAVRASVGVLDRSGWARLQLTGADRLDFLQRMSTNDFAELPAGTGRATVLPDSRGRMIDRVLVYGWEDEALLIGSLGANKRLAAWLRQYIFFRDQVAVADITAETGLLTLYGPQTLSVVASLFGNSETRFFEKNGFLDGYGFAPLAEAEVLIGGTDPLAGGGLNIIAEADRIPDLWARLVAAGVTPIGYAAYDRLRIEAGWPEYGREIVDAYNPLEAGLLNAVSFTKGCYIGQEVIARLDTYQKLKQHLMGLRFANAVETSVGAAIEMGGRVVGSVTSVASGDDTTVGLGYVRASCAQPGATVSVTTNDGCAPAELIALPGRWTRPFGMASED